MSAAVKPVSRTLAGMVIAAFIAVTAWAETDAKAPWICTNLSSVDSYRWLPGTARDGESEAGLSEVALRVSRELLGDDVRALGIRELYEVADMSSDEIAQLLVRQPSVEIPGQLYWIGARLDKGDTRLTVSVTDPADRSIKLPEERDGVVVTDIDLDATDHSDSKTFVAAVERALIERGLDPASSTRTGYEQFSLFSHQKNALGSIAVKLGRRFAYPHEKGFLRQAASLVPSRLSPESAHIESALLVAEFSIRAERTAMKFDGSSIHGAARVLARFEGKGVHVGDYHLLRALVTHIRGGSRNRVIERLRRTLDFYPARAEAKFVLGQLAQRYDLDSEHKQASDDPTTTHQRLWYEAALDDNPTYLRAWAYVALKQQDLSGFERIFAEARYDHAPAHYNRARVLEGRGQLAEADKAYEEAHKSGYEPRTVFRMRARIAARLAAAATSADVAKRRFEQVEFALVRALSQESSITTLFPAGQAEGGLGATTSEAHGKTDLERLERAVELLANQALLRGWFTRDEQILTAVIEAKLGNRREAASAAENLRINSSSDDPMDADETLMALGLAAVYHRIDDPNLAKYFAERAWAGTFR